MMESILVGDCFILLYFVRSLFLVVHFLEKILRALHPDKSEEPTTPPSTLQYSTYDFLAFFGQSLFQIKQGLLFLCVTSPLIYI